MYYCTAVQYTQSVSKLINNNNNIINHINKLLYHHCTTIDKPLQGLLSVNAASGWLRTLPTQVSPARHRQMAQLCWCADSRREDMYTHMECTDSKTWILNNSICLWVPGLVPLPGLLSVNAASGWLRTLPTQVSPARHRQMAQFHWCAASTITHHRGRTCTHDMDCTNIALNPARMNGKLNSICIWVPGLVKLLWVEVVEPVRRQRVACSQ